MKNDKNNIRTEQLEEQEAPLKNTDNAFVKVSRDGSPEMPEVEKEEDEKKEGMSEE